MIYKYYKNILNWLISRVSNKGFMVPEIGLYCDQRWLSLASQIFSESILVSKDPSLNIGYWNLKEREIIITLDQFDSILINAYNTLNPSLIANYTYDLVKQFNSFYQSYSIVGKQPVNSFRLALSKKVGDQIKLSMSLLGIDCPERM